MTEKPYTVNPSTITALGYQSGIAVITAHVGTTVKLALEAAAFNTAYNAAIAAGQSAAAAASAGIGASEAIATST